MRLILRIFVYIMSVTTIMPAYAVSFDWLSAGVGASAASGLNGFIGFQKQDARSPILCRTRFRLDFASTKPIHSTYDSVVDSFIGDGGYQIDDIIIKDVDIVAKHMSWIFDYYPLRDSYRWCGLRFTLGYMKGLLKVDSDLTGVAAGAPAGSFGFKLGNTYYYYTGNTIHGTSQIKWEYHGPYIGTGFDFGIFNGLNVYVDAGVVFTGRRARAKLNVPFKNLYQSTDGGITWENVIDDGLESAVEAERQQALANVQRDLDKLHFLPVIKLGFMYQF